MEDLIIELANKGYASFSISGQHLVIELEDYRERISKSLNPDQIQELKQFLNNKF